MFSPFSHDAASAQRRQEPDDRRSNSRNAAWTLIASASDYQSLFRPANLSLPQPRLGSKARVGGRWQRLPQVQNVLDAKLGFVERLPDRVE